MAVPGRKLPDYHGSVSHGSTEDFSHSCDPCLTEDQHVAAHGYCIDCNEYLCFNCFRYHKRTRALKDHRLLDKDNMDKHDISGKLPDICTEKCTIHVNEVIKFFCPAHEALGCNDCIIMNHRTCDIDYIPEKCADIENTEEYNDVMKELDQKTAEVDAVVKKANEKDSLIDACFDQAVLDMDKFHNDLVHHLVEHQKQVKKEADSRKSKDKEKVKEVITSCTAVSSNTNLLRSNIADSTAAKQNGQIFIAIKRAKTALKSNDVKEADKNLCKIDVQYKYERNKALENMLIRKDALGKLIYPKVIICESSKLPVNPIMLDKTDTKKSNIKDNTHSKGIRNFRVPDRPQIKDQGNFSMSDHSKPVHKVNYKMSDHSQSVKTNVKMSNHSHATDTDNNNATDKAPAPQDHKKMFSIQTTKLKPPYTLIPSEQINVTTETDLESCGISGCAILSSQRLLIADTDNMKLKIVNLQRPLQSVVEEKILEAPPKDIAALPIDKAAVTLPDKRKILIVTAEDKLSIKNTINVEGICRGITYHQDCLYVVCWRPYCVFVLEMNGSIKYAISLPSKFLSPQFIVFNPVFHLIYVSDINRHSICSLTLQGDTADVYTDKGFRPAGMVLLDDGSLLVCNQYDNSICCISGDLKQKWQMTRPSRGLWKPLSLCHSSAYKKVYIGALNSGQLKTFSSQHG